MIFPFSDISLKLSIQKTLRSFVYADTKNKEAARMLAPLLIDYDFPLEYALRVRFIFLL
jgi:hypothetical protein